MIRHKRDKSVFVYPKKGIAMRSLREHSYTKRYTGCRCGVTLSVKSLAFFFYLQTSKIKFELFLGLFYENFRLITLIKN